MNHRDALQEMAVERYLLGELRGASLDSFEEHLFECSECAADVKAGATFVDAARTELSASRRAVAPRWTSWFTSPWFTSPWVLAPALAACLLVVAFQIFVVQPHMRLEVARAQTPAVLNSLVLANAGPRGGSIPEIVAPARGDFAVSLDVPATGSFSSYRCSLYTPDGSLAWQTAVSPEQARDALLIRMPTDKVREGMNVFLIQGVPAGGGSSGTLEDLARYRFRVKIQN